MVNLFLKEHFNSPTRGIASLFCSASNQTLEREVFFFTRCKMVRSEVFSWVNWIHNIYIYIFYLDYTTPFKGFTTGATTVGVTVVASLKLCTMQYKNIIDTLISTIIVNKNLVCYTYFHWFFSPECQHIFGKQTGYIFHSPKTIKTWTIKHYASLNQWYNTG
jgi:hypothetical protein